MVDTRPPRRRQSLLWHIWAPGLGLAAGAFALAAAIGLLDAARSDRYRSLGALLTPDAAGASWTMALVGTSEGVAIAIVVVVVVLGVQLTADRYSPRIIDIFVRDPMNLVVLGLFCGSIVFSILVSSEIKADYVPLAGVFTAVVLAVADFALLLPYVRYMFSIMRAETIIHSIGRRGAAALGRAAEGGRGLAARHAMRDVMAQISDIALGSIQKGDTEVCLAAVEALRALIVERYLPVKGRLEPWWFGVDAVDMPGASDQTIAQVDRTGTWVEHTVLSDFVNLIGETPAFRKEVIHAIARSSRSIGEAALARGDRHLEELVVRFFNTYLRASMNQRAPTFVYSIFNEYRQLAVSAIDARPELLPRVAEHLVGYGRSFEAAGMPFAIGTAAEDVVDMAVRAAGGDPGRTLLLARLLARTLSAMAPAAQPVALGGVLKAALKLSLWSLATGHGEITETLLTGIGTVSPAFTEDTLARMERTTEDVFWEVSDRVVAFDWVDAGLRELIPELRQRLADQAEDTVAAAATARPPGRRPPPA